MLGCVRSSPPHCAGLQPCCSCRFSVTGTCHKLGPRVEAHPQLAPPSLDRHRSLQHTVGGVPQRSAKCGNAVVRAIVRTLPSGQSEERSCSFVCEVLPAAQLPA